MYPFTGGFHDLDGLKMHFLNEGEGKTVVMLHGNPTWSFFYRRVVLALRDEFRCVVPDHIGMGFSDKPQGYPYLLENHIDNLERLLEAQIDFSANPEKKISLIVHDWGGAIGMGYATRYPERIAKIVVLNTAAFLSPRIPFRINLCRIPLFGTLAVRGFNAFAGCATFMTTVTPLPQRVKDAFLLPYDNWRNRIATHRFVQDIPLRESHPTYATVKEIENKLKSLTAKPMLIQWGEKDWCFDMQFYEEWRNRFPEAEYDVYHDAGHYLLEDAHDRIVPRIREFLQ